MKLPTIIKLLATAAVIFSATSKADKIFPLRIRSEYEEGGVTVNCYPVGEEEAFDCDVNLIEALKPIQSHPYKIAYFSFFGNGTRTVCNNLSNDKVTLSQHKKEQNHFLVTRKKDKVPKEYEKCPMASPAPFIRNEL